MVLLRQQISWGSWECKVVSRGTDYPSFPGLPQVPGLPENLLSLSVK